MDYHGSRESAHTEDHARLLEQSSESLLPQSQSGVVIRGSGSGNSPLPVLLDIMILDIIVLVPGI